MYQNPCSLVSLPDEILVEILRHLDVADVVRLSATCKRLRKVCLARPVWLSLMQTLDATQAPNIKAHCPPVTLPTEVLQEKVVRAVQTSQSWRTPGKLQAVEKASFSISPRFEIDGNAIDDVGNIDPLLLPDEKHVLIENRGRLELWSIEPRSRIWTVQPGREGDCIAFDFELVDDGRAMMVVVLFLNIAQGCFFQVYKFEFETWTTALLAERDLPTVFLFRMMLRGDLVMIHIPHSFQIILYNWRSGATLVLNFTNEDGHRTNARAAIVSGEHLFIVLHLGAFSLVALPLSLLQEAWSYSPELPEGTDIVFSCATRDNPDPTPRTGIDFDSSHRPDHALRLRLADVSTRSGEEPYVLGLHAYTPLWKDPASEVLEPTEIFIAAYDNVQSAKKKSLLSYRIQLSRVTDPLPASLSEPALGVAFSDPPINAISNDSWRLSLVSQTRAPAARLPWNSRSMSNAGTMFSMQERLYCYTLFTEQPQPTNMVTLPPTSTVTVEPVSGQIACASPDGVVRILELK